MSRLQKYLAIAVAALSVAALLPQAAWAVEGMGAYKGSLIFFPYWNNVGSNRTYFRISMDNELNDIIPLGTIQLHMFYLVRNPAAIAINQEIPACLEFDRYLRFTENDWELVNTYGHNNQFAGGDGRMGWAFAYATLSRPDAPRQKLLWDRFFSDTFIVDTSLGTMTGWNNEQIWGNGWTNPFAFNIVGPPCFNYTRDIQNDEFGVPPNPVCLLGPDDGVAVLYSGPIGVGGDYVTDDFADTFNWMYFTQRRNLRGGTFSPSQVSITAVHVDDQWNPFFTGIPTAAFLNIADDTDDMSYQFDVEVFDHNEVVYSGPPQFIICHGLRTVHQVTNGITNNLRQGHVNLWEVDFVFGVNASEDAVLVGIDTLNNISGNAALDAAFGSYVAHNRTTAPLSLFEVFNPGIPTPTLWDPDLGAGDP